MIIIEFVEGVGDSLGAVGVFLILFVPIFIVGSIMAMPSYLDLVFNDPDTTLPDRILVFYLPLAEVILLTIVACVTDEPQMVLCNLVLGPVTFLIVEFITSGGLSGLSGYGLLYFLASPIAGLATIWIPTLIGFLIAWLTAKVVHG